MKLEHVNVTVPDARATAEKLCDLFGWHIRWEGASIHNGYSVHVGETDSYLALYSPGVGLTEATNSYTQISGLNHIAVVVDDLDGLEARVKSLGYTPQNHADYEPGRRFYFDGPDGIEFEAVSYA